MSYQAFHFGRRKQAICFVLPILISLLSIWAYGQASSGSALQHYKKGVAALEKQQLDAAIVELSLSTKINPRFADAHNALGKAQARKGDIKAAGVSFRRAIEINPRFYEAHLGLAYVLQQTGDLDAAIAANRQLNSSRVK